MSDDNQSETTRALFSCTPSRQWVATVLRQGPFADEDALKTAAEGAWNGLSPDALPSLLDQYLPLSAAPDNPFAAAEHAVMLRDNPHSLSQLAELESRYRDRYGFAAVIAVEGMSLPDVIALLHTRLGHDRPTELEVARGELTKIGRNRLRSVIASGQIPGINNIQTPGSRSCVLS
jgi:2-oxo-4-hydroxy-4-carboxy-5-ureidoimidazoline decarboxylase